MTSREGHFEAVGFAGLKVEEMQAALASVLPIAEEALGTIANAIGESDRESATNAHAFTAEIIDRVTELVGQCENVKAELQRYQSGF